MVARNANSEPEISVAVEFGPPDDGLEKQSKQQGKRLQVSRILASDSRGKETGPCQRGSLDNPGARREEATLLEVQSTFRPVMPGCIEFCLAFDPVTRTMCLSAPVFLACREPPPCNVQ